jgi:hypothetical protein
VGACLAPVVAASRGEGVHGVDVDLAAGGERGTVMRVDPRTFRPDQPVEVLGQAESHLSARATDRALYVADEASTTPEPVAERSFEMFAEDGFVFYNDPESERAGVIHVALLTDPWV